MRWLVLWLLLTVTLFAGTQAIGLALGCGWALDRETLAGLAVIPAVQVLALRVVRFVRRAGS
jgi:hypothetical protein